MAAAQRPLYATKMALFSRFVAVVCFLKKAYEALSEASYCNPLDEGFC